MSIAVMSEMFAIPFGNATRKMVAIRLADFADDHGRGIWPSVDTLAEQCELSPRTVQRVLGEFVEEGILVKRQQGGGRKTSRYDFDLTTVRARKAPPAQTEKPQNQPVETAKNLPDDEGCHGVTGDTDDVRGDTVSPLGCQGVTRTVNEPSITIKEREGACAQPSSDDEGEQTGQPEKPADQPTASKENEKGSEGVQADPATVPNTAAFEKRVMAFCNGKGFSAGVWKDWDTATLGYHGRQFAKLSEADRQAAERWRDAYLRDMTQRKKKPVSPGNFLRDRMWEALDPTLLTKADKAAAKGAKAGEVPKPDGWAVAWGPVWNAYLIKALLGPRADGKTDVPLLRADIAKAWPVIAQLQAAATARHGSVMPDAMHALRDQLEPVPVASTKGDWWRDLFKAHGWPWLAEFNNRDVVFLPKDLTAFAELIGSSSAEGRLPREGSDGQSALAGDTSARERDCASGTFAGSDSGAAASERSTNKGDAP